MSDTFNCPNCGAPLDYQGSDPIIRCPFCNSSVIVPDNLRAKPAFSSQPHNFTLSGIGDMGGLINQARRLKEVKDLAQSGKEVEAAQLFAQITGVSLDQAHIAVEALTRGKPIAISGLNMEEIASSVQMVTPPAINIKPVDEKTSRGIARWLGCGLSCFVVGLVSFILLVTMVPALGTVLGVAVGLNPKLVLTVLPAISDTTAFPEVPTLPTLPQATPGFANQLFSFGGEGNGPGLFGDVRAIAVDPNEGTIFAANYDDGKVQVFNSQGKFITQWIVEGNNPYIQGLAADRKGNIYVVVFGNILVYNADGELKNTFKPASIKDHYEDIALGADGSLMVVSRGENIIHLSTTGKVLNRFDGAISHVTGNSELKSNIAVDGLGNIYLLGSFNNAVFIYNSAGKFSNHFGSAGDEPGQFRAPYAIAVDGKGRIYVSDFKGIQIFSNDGRFNNVIKVKGISFGMIFDDQGILYITTNQKKIEKYQIPQ